MVEDFVAGMLRNKNIGATFIRDVWCILHKIFANAVKRRLIVSNPASGIELPKPDKSKRIVPELDEVIATLAKLPLSHQALFYTGMHSGARRSELCALRWKNVDLLRRTLKIENSVHRILKKLIDDFRNVDRVAKTAFVLGPPKSKAGERSIGMSNELANALTALRPFDAKADDFVFQTITGDPLDPHRITALVLAARRAAGGARKWSMHSLRHLYASLLSKTGAPVKLTQTIMGHEDSKTTLNIYTHLLDEGEVRNAAQSVSDSFASVSITLANPRLGEQPPTSSSELTLISTRT